MQELNARVDIDKEKPADAAARVPAGVRLRRVGTLTELTGRARGARPASAQAGFPCHLSAKLVVAP